MTIFRLPTSLYAISALIASMSFSHAEDIPSDSHFKVETLVEKIEDGMEIAVKPNGDVVIVERKGQIKEYVKADGKARAYQKLEVVEGIANSDDPKAKTYARESGLLGVALDPNFAKNNWIYMFNSPVKKDAHHISRFEYTADGLKNEKVLLEIPNHREDNTCHEGGSLAFGPDGNLYISIGDNTCPFESEGKAPLDERKNREGYDSQRSAANSNDLRGSILRIKPKDDGTYEIPEGNLYKKGTPNTRPEIFAKGCRNPWRISVDPVKGWLHWGEVGPDGAADDERGPHGYDELNQAQQAGYYGWPYLIASNIPYGDYDFKKEKVGDKFDPEKLSNDSPNNTGLKELPTPVPALWTQPRACACAGPVLRSETYSNKSSESMPASMDGNLVFYDWNKGALTLMKLDDNGKIEKETPFLSKSLFIHPADVEIGADGCLYVLEYGSKWYNGNDGRLLKISYSATELEEPKEPQQDVRLAGLDMKHPGSIVLKDSVCISCHQTQVKSIGPSYKEVAIKYRDDKDSVKKLTEKIIKGGGGVWGQIPMPPNPQYNEEQVSQMVESIMKLAEEHK